MPIKYLNKFEDLRQLVANKYTAEYGGSYHVKSLLNWYRYVKYAVLVSKCIPKNGKVIDVGCGGGEPTVMVKLFRPDCEVWGVDIKKQITWDALEKYAVKFAVCNAENMNLFKNNEFDTVMSVGAIEHAKNDKKFLKEMVRILKPNGHMFIFDLPNKYGLSEFMADILIGTHHHDKKYTTGKIRKMVSKYCKQVKVTRDNFIPAQLHRLSEGAGEWMNAYSLLLFQLDQDIKSTPLSFFSQSITIECRKK